MARILGPSDPESNGDSGRHRRLAWGLVTAARACARLRTAPDGRRLPPGGAARPGGAALPIGLQARGARGPPAEGPGRDLQDRDRDLAGSAVGSRLRGGAPSALVLVVD